MCSSGTPLGCSLSDATLRWSFRAKGERPPATLWQPYGLTSACEFGRRCPNSSLLPRRGGRTTRPLLASARKTQRPSAVSLSSFGGEGQGEEVVILSEHPKYTGAATRLRVTPNHSIGNGTGPPLPNPLLQRRRGRTTRPLLACTIHQSSKFKVRGLRFRVLCHSPSSMLFARPLRLCNSFNHVTHLTIHSAKSRADNKLAPHGTAPAAQPRHPPQPDPARPALRCVFPPRQ